MKPKLIPTLAILSLMLGASIIGWYACLWTRPILPVSTRQRRLYEYGYLPYEWIDGKCGTRTHTAEKLYHRDWKTVKTWKARIKPTEPKYRIAWKSLITGIAGEGETEYSKEIAEKIVKENNSKYDDEISHWIVEQK